MITTILNEIKAKFPHSTIDGNCIVVPFSPLHEVNMHLDVTECESGFTVRSESNAEYTDFNGFTSAAEEYPDLNKDEVINVISILIQESDAQAALNPF